MSCGQGQQQSALGLRIAVRQQHMRHPISGRGGEPRRLIRLTPLPVVPPRHHLRAPRDRLHHKQVLRRLEDRIRHAAWRGAAEPHQRPATVRRALLIPHGLDAHQRRQFLGRGVTDDQLAAAAHKSRERPHLFRRRLRNVDEHGDLLAGERGLQVGVIRQDGLHARFAIPPLDVLSERLGEPALADRQRALPLHHSHRSRLPNKNGGRQRHCHQTPFHPEPRFFEKG